MRFVRTLASMAVAAGCSEGPPPCHPVGENVEINVDGEWLPRCGFADWPTEFAPPPPDPEFSDELPPPFDRPDEDPPEELGGTLFTFGAGARAEFVLQTIWADEEHPPELRLGHATNVDARQDYYCLVNSLPHPCAWNDEVTPWLSFEEFDPVRAWTIRLVDPPQGGFDWTILWAERSLEDEAFPYAFGDIERVYVHYGSIDVRPRFDPVLWELATPEVRGANVSISVVPLGPPIARSGDTAAITVRLWNQESCTIPVEATFLSEGRAVERATPEGPQAVWSLEIEPGDREVQVELLGVGSLPAGAPLFVHGFMYPGVPGVGVKGGDRCAAASAGIMQGIGLGPFSVFD